MLVTTVDKKIKFYQRVILMIMLVFMPFYSVGSDFFLEGFPSSSIEVVENGVHDVLDFDDNASLRQTMLTKMTAFLARAPALQGLSLTVGDVGPAPYTAGLWCRGITVLDRRENLLGRVTQRCRAEFTLRLCLPRTDADNAARLLDLQTWAAAESAAGRGPVLGNAGREVLRAEQGRMERADAGGTAVYTVRLQAEYTQVYTEETT